MKSDRIISAEQVGTVFDAECIERLANLGKLPKNADRGRFGEGVRYAARWLAGAVTTPTQNQLIDEISKLESAARRRKYSDLVNLLEELSSKTKSLLEKCAKLPGLQTQLPSAQDLRDSKKQVSAADTIRMLTAMGGRYTEGRHRPSGKRSVTWVPILKVSPSGAQQKRAEERLFIMLLQAAWLNATNSKPALTARNNQKGPFAEMVGECLRLVGAPYANAVQLINDIDKQRRADLKDREDKAPLPRMGPVKD